jgi:hypothetical protein
MQMRDVADWLGAGDPSEADTSVSWVQRCSASPAAKYFNCQNAVTPVFEPFMAPPMSG